MPTDGRQRRLARLVRNGYFCVLAMDHGLSQGRVDSLETVLAISDQATRAWNAGVPAIVANAGVLHHLEIPPGLTVVAQTVGLPLYAYVRSRRTVISDVRSALRDGADVISVQLALDSPDLADSVTAVADVVGQAHYAGVPALLMLSGMGGFADGAADLTDIVRSFSELGADLLKLDPGDAVFDLPDGALSTGVPVLFAGGAANPTFWDRASNAARVGCAGVCVGRSLFQAALPIAESVHRLDKIFAR